MIHGYLSSSPVSKQNITVLIIQVAQSCPKQDDNHDELMFFKLS